MPRLVHFTWNTLIWFIFRILHQLRELACYVRTRILWHMQDRADKKGMLPDWADFDVDCGFSDKWYRCRTCLMCDCVDNPRKLFQVR